MSRLYAIIYKAVVEMATLSGGVFGPLLHEYLNNTNLAVFEDCYQRLLHSPRAVRV